MSDNDVHDSFIEVGRVLGFVATHRDESLSAHLADNAFRGPNGGGVFRMPSSAVAYLQAPTGWRQRVRLTVLLREDHPLSAIVPRHAEEPAPTTPVAYRPPRLAAGREFDALLGHLSVLARSGMPVVIEKCVADRLRLDDLSPRVVGPDGVQVLQRQTLRVWNTLAVWMREHTRSPRGLKSPLRGEEPDDFLPASAGEGAPILL